MISSGESMIDTAKQLKSMNAKHVFICTTFGLFTNGFAAFDQAYALSRSRYEQIPCLYH